MTYILSASSVTTYLRCGQQWFFAYVAGVKMPPSLRAIRGIAVHRAVEWNMSQKIRSYQDLPVDEVLDAFSDSWDFESIGAPEKDDNETAGQIKDKGYDLIKLYHEKVAPKIQPILVEEPIQFKINDQVYSGQIDIAERAMLPKDLEINGARPKLVVRDTKTTKRTPKEDAYMLAMTGYALSQRQKTGEVEGDIVLDYLVATKEPQYKEIRYGGPVSDDQIRKFANIVQSVGSSIKAGRFPPNGLVSGACTWCGYKAICPAYVGK